MYVESETGVSLVHSASNYKRMLYIVVSTMMLHAINICLSITTKVEINGIAWFTQLTSFTGSKGNMCHPFTLVLLMIVLLNGENNSIIIEVQLA